MKTIHALFVAIDAYPIKGKELNGCKNDAISMRQYVEAFAASNGTTCRTKNVFDAEASRQNVITQLQTFFKDVKDGDTALFYFSGHGSQIPAPPQFWYESDRMLGTLVCHDSRLLGGRDLIDKELSYLLYNIKQGKPNLHLVAITDCCHSAGNTRGDAEVAKALIRERGIEPNFQAPNFATFVGSAQYEKSPDGKYFYPPIAAHVALSAARADQKAKEYPIGGVARGVFTVTLIEALEASGGRIGYTELLQKTNAQVKNRAADQAPQLDTYVDTDALAAMPFLNIGVALRNGDFVVVFDQDSQTWQLKAGAIQGISTMGCTVSVAGKTFKTAQINSNFSTLEAVGEALDKAQTYSASIAEMQKTPLRLAFAPKADTTAVAVLKKLYNDKIATTSYPEWTLTDDATQADYRIQANNQKIWLSNPNDAIPIFERVNTADAKNFVLFADNLATVARWKAKHGLQNPFTTLTTTQVAIDVFLVDNVTNVAMPIDFKPNAAPLVLRQPIIGGVVKGAKFQLRIRNLSAQRLWTSALYFDSRFGITNSLLRKAVLPPNNGEAWLTVESKGQILQTINASVPEAYLSWGVNEMHDFVKILVSTEELDTSIHNQTGLKLDVRGDVRTKDLGDDDDTFQAVPMSDWCAFDVPITIIRPTVATALSNAATALVGNVKVTAPTGFQGSVALNSSADMLRTLKKNDSDSTREMDASELQNAETHRQKMFDALPMQGFGEGKSGIPPLDAIELFNVSNEQMSMINTDNPLVVQLGQAPRKDESVLAFAYDDASGLMIPVGVSDQNGALHISSLPTPTPMTRGMSSASMLTERSLGESLQLFFRRVVNNWTGDGDEGLQKLRLAIFDDPNSEVFRYESDSNAISAAVEKAKNIALFIHGIIGDTRAMPQCLVRIRNEKGENLLTKYDTILTFDYENLGTPIEKTAESLKKHLAKIGLDGTSSDKKLDIVAHSMGGLVSRWFIENPTLKGNAVVRTLVQCGTPNGGSEWSDVEKMLSHCLTLAINGASKMQPWIAPLSAALKWIGLGSIDTTLKAMNPDKSPFLTALNTNPSDPSVPYHVIVGNTQLIRTQNEAHWNFIQKVMNNLRTRGVYAGFDQFLFKDQPNDICVRVNSITAIPHKNWQNTPTTVEVASDHLSYFEQTDSLRELGVVLWQV